jgi:hypothetical protein
MNSSSPNKKQKTSEGRSKRSKQRIMLDDGYFRALIARDGPPVIEKIDLEKIKMNLLKQMGIPVDATLKKI